MWARASLLDKAQGDRGFWKSLRRSFVGARCSKWTTAAQPARGGRGTSPKFIGCVCRFAFQNRQQASSRLGKGLKPAGRQQQRTEDRRRRECKLSRGAVGDAGAEKRSCRFAGGVLEVGEDSGTRHAKAGRRTSVWK